jgi:exopolyphosphatase/guanosine-5'-triphosphate,3'-diphosphate pyrophosphatase
VPNDKKVAVIDVGSNSIKLLIARRGLPTCPVEPVFTETIETRISAGISHDQPELTKKAMCEGLASISELLSLAEKFEPQHTRLVATSAVRDARNGMDFVDRIRDKTAHIMQILSGHQEASYIGSGLSCDPQLQGVKNFLQMDLGGGSLELVRFEENTIQEAISLQLGSVRLTEALLPDREAPLHPDTQNKIREAVDHALAQASFNFSPPEWPLLITGGAATITRAILAARSDCSIEAFAPQIKLETLTALAKELSAMTLHQRLAIPHLPARRADILPAALLTIERILELANRRVITHSFYNLRYGVAHEALNN